MILDIEMFEDGEYGEGKGPQAKYLVHGRKDILWTNDFVNAIMFFVGSMKEAGGEQPDGFCAICGERCDYC